MQSALPAVPWDRPTGQLMHAVCAVDGWYSPAAPVAHAVEDVEIKGAAVEDVETTLAKALGGDEAAKDAARLIVADHGSTYVCA